jgi:adenosylcobinamide-GDP ribazoletransferase
MVIAAYVVGTLAALPFLLPLPPVTAGPAYVLALLGLTGITHLDGLADVGDAAVIHGSAAERRDVMGDSALGVGGTVAVVIDLLGLTLAGVALAGLPIRSAVAIVLVAEVAAKLAMVALAALGDPAHEGLGAHLTGAGPGTLLVGALLAVPAALLAWPSPIPAASLLLGLATSAVVLAWARARIGGLTGDVFGATNELARLVALHAGVVAWTLS